MRTITEIEFSHLPAKLAHLLEHEVAEGERVILCLVYEDIRRLPLLGEHVTHNAAIITDYRLIITNQGMAPFALPSGEHKKRKIYTIPLDSIKEVKIENGFLGRSKEIHLDYGRKYPSHYDGDVPDPDYLRISFDNQDDVLLHFKRRLSYAQSNAFLRSRTPEANCSDLASDVKRLFALRHSGDLSEAQLETAILKLLE